MKQPALILNADYTPYSVCSWKDAIILAYAKDKDGYIVATYDEVIYDSAGRAYNLPAVLVLNTYMADNNKKCTFSKTAIHLRDNYTCQYCGKVSSKTDSTIDHIIPKSSQKQNYNSFENCVSCCKSCNRKKADKTLLASGLKLRRQPKSITKAQKLYYSIIQKGYPKEWEPYIHSLPF